MPYKFNPFTGSLDYYDSAASDPTLDALALLDATPGLVEQTGADTFTKRPIGVALGTDIPTRADGDVRWQAAGDYQPHDADLDAIAALTTTPYGRAFLPLADATAARAHVGTVIGTDVQAQNANLSAIAGLTSAADKLPYFTGAGTADVTTLTLFARTLIDDADATAARATLGLVIGTNVQAWDADLDGISGLPATAGMLSRTAAGAFAARTLTGTAGEIDVANGTGATLNPTFSLPSTIVLTGKAVTAGTFNGPTIASPVSITGVPDPSAAQDVATKAYVDSVSAGLDVKASVRCATTANVTIATALNSGDVIDGITLANGDRVLVKNQTAPAENGVYVVSASPARAADMDAWAEVPGSFVFVEESGGTQADTAWVCTANVAGGVLGTTAITWTQFAGAGTFTAGAGLTLTGTQFSITTAGITASMMGVASVDLATTVVTGTLPIAKGGTNKTTWTLGSVVVATSANVLGEDSLLNWDNTAKGLGIGAASSAQLSLDGTYTNNANARLVYIHSQLNTTATAIYGMNVNYTFNSSAATVTAGYGILFIPIYTGAANVTNAYGFYQRTDTTSYSGTIANTMGLYVDAPVIGSGGGAITTFTGVYVANVTTATNNRAFRGSIASGASRYNLYMEGSADNYIAGQVGVGTLSPTAQLHLSGTYSTNNLLLYLNATMSGTSTVELVGIQSTPGFSPGGASLTSAIGLSLFPRFTATAVPITNAIAFDTFLRTDAGYTGTLTNVYMLRIQAPVFNGSNPATSLYGIDIGALAASGTPIIRGIRSQVASGTNKHNLYVDGTASNYLAGSLGIGATTPTNALSFGGDAARKIWLERTTGTTGFDLTIEAGGAVSAGTNRAGGNLALRSGISTGSAASSITFSVPTPGGSGTSDNSFGERMRVASLSATLGGVSISAPGVTMPSPVVGLEVYGSIICSPTGTQVSTSTFTFIRNDNVAVGMSFTVRNGAASVSNYTLAGTATTQGFVISDAIDSTTMFSLKSRSAAIGTTTQTALFQVGALAITKAAPTTTGAWFSVPAATLTDSSTAGSGTAATGTFNAFGVPTYAASNTNVTVTDLANVYIAGAPIRGTNLLSANSRLWSLWVDSGNVRFDGNVAIGQIAFAANANNVLAFVSNGATAPTAIAGVGQVYVTATGSLRYRGPTSDSLLANP